MQQGDDCDDKTAECDDSKSQPFSNDSVVSEGSSSQHDNEDTVVITEEQAYEIMIQYATAHSWKEAYERVMAKKDDGDKAEQAECKGDGHNRNDGVEIHQWNH